jgi:hypothetical protein
MLGSGVATATTIAVPIPDIGDDPGSFEASAMRAQCRNSPCGCSY